MLIGRTTRSWLKRIWIQSRQDVRIAAGADVGLDVHFEGMNAVFGGCVIGSSTIGRGTYIAASSIVKRTRIGRFCSIGAEVRTSLGVHPVSPFASTHPAFFSTSRQAGFCFVQETRFDEHRRVPGSEFSVVIGNDVWIGDRAMIMDGVTIGDGAVVGAAALVTRSVEPYSIVVGVPARHLKYRFDEDVRAALQNLAWWDRSPEWLRDHAEQFADAAMLVGITQASPSQTLP